MTTATVLRTSDGTSLIGTAWRIDPAHTAVEFAVKHLMITTVKGRFAKVAGSAYINANNLRPEVDVTIQAASIDTREAKRDEHLKSADFLEAERYPTITFTGRRIEGDPMDEFRLVGDLTIRGVTREIALEVQFEGQTNDPWGGERVGFSAQTRFNRKDFGLHWNVALEAGGVLVGDEVRLTIDAQLVRQADAKVA